MRGRARCAAAPALAVACLILLVAGAPAQPAAARPSYPGLGQGPRRPGASVVTCACIDSGINTPPCFKGVTSYCENAAASPDMAVCAAMSGFLNDQKIAAGKVVSQFLVTTCGAVLPPNPNACACLGDLESSACKAAALNACLLGNTICPALVFGGEADTASQESFQSFVSRQCPDAIAITRVDLNFTGVSKEAFDNRFGRSAADALATIVGVPTTAVTLAKATVLTVPAAAPTGRRRLLQDTKQIIAASYEIRSPITEAQTILNRLSDAAANGGQGLYAALAAKLTPLKPSFRIFGAPGTKLPPKKPAGGLSTAAIIAIAASAGGVVLLGIVALTVWLCLRKKLPAKKAAGTVNSAAPPQPQPPKQQQQQPAAAAAAAAVAEGVRGAPPGVKVPKNSTGEDDEFYDADPHTPKTPQK